VVGGHPLIRVPRGHEQIVVGIRPEALRIQPPSAEGIRVRAEFHEPLGSHVLVHAVVDDVPDAGGTGGTPTALVEAGGGTPPGTGARTIVVQAPPGMHPEPGQPLTLAAGRVFLFDAATSAALDQAGAGAAVG